jgi:TolB-like protein/predicted Ser/Thr protein kinase
MSMRERAFGDDITIERELGGGGMSVVYLCQDRVHNRQLAVKVMKGGLSEDRFRREVLTTASLQHPNIVPIIGSGAVDGLPYLVMPFIAGESLRSRLDRSPPLTTREIVSILRDVTRALAHAHRAGVIHRDIKPDNILLAGDAAMVTDFGIAKAVGEAAERLGGSGGSLTQVGAAVGTPRYMAPEQLAGDAAIDGRADLYALGATLYEALAHQPAFPQPSVTALLRAKLDVPKSLVPLPAEAPPGLRELATRLLAADPAERPPTADDVIVLLDDVTTSGVRSRAVTRAALPRRSVVLAIAAAAVIAVGGWMALSTRMAPSPSLHDVAVVPFVDLSEGGDNARLAAVFTDALITDLARLGGGRVASRTAVESGLRSGLDSQAIARQLRVGSLVEGTVERDGDRVTITVRVVNARDGSVIWADLLEGGADSLPALRQDVAARVREALGTG